MFEDPSSVEQREKYLKKQVLNMKRNFLRHDVETGAGEKKTFNGSCAIEQKQEKKIPCKLLRAFLLLLKKKMKTNFIKNLLII